MENVINVVSTFSVFGNVSDLISKISDVKSAFADFKCEESNGTLPNGLPAKTFMFTKESKAVIIRNYRIDLQYGYILENGDTIETFLSFVNDAVEKLQKIGDTKFNRVAYTDTQFVKKSEENMAKFNSLFAVSNVFGSSADELQIRVNNVTDVSGETTNAVLLAQNGAVQKKGTMEKEEVIFINNDINTLAQERENRFTWESGAKLLQDFIMLAKERTNKVVNNL